MATEEKEKLSPVETIKTESNYLRGEIAQELVDGNDHFGKASDHCSRTTAPISRTIATTGPPAAATGGKSAKASSFMVRTKIPGGKLTSEQLLAELDLCDEVGNTTLRITSRQGLQLHGVLKGELWHTIHRINEIQLSTLAACGDVERNVMCCPAPHHQDPMHERNAGAGRPVGRRIFARGRRAYHEIWLTDPESARKQLVGGGPRSHEVEPIYGPTYLPRKFKTAIGLPDDNCVDLYANDLGLMAICEDDRIIGYNVLVGGGMGVTPSAKKTFPAVAKRMAFIRPEQAVDVATAVIMVQRDFGNRSDRKVARLKYLIANWGLERFKAKVEEYYGQPLADPHPRRRARLRRSHRLARARGRPLFYGLNIENGRIPDDDGCCSKPRCARFARTYQARLRLTPHQSILFTDVAAENRERDRKHSSPPRREAAHEISKVRRWSMACVAWPTCGLAITEAERALPGMIDQLEVELARLGLSRELFTRPHDRLPERLCPAVQLRHRPGRQSGRQVHDLCRRPAAGRPAEFHLQGHGPGGRGGADAGAAVGLFQARPAGGRNVRRILPPQRGRRPDRLERPAMNPTPGHALPPPMANRLGQN